MSGRTSNYSVMCEVFMRDFLGEKDVPGSLTLDQDDMILVSIIIFTTISLWPFVHSGLYVCVLKRQVVGISL